MKDLYKLELHVPVPCFDFLDWATWYETANRTVAKTDVGNAEVSTVFLGLDHSFGEGPPLLFETMVFGGPLDGEQDRYRTWPEAMQGHEAMVQRCKEATP